MPLTGKRIMIVDDEPDTLTAIRMILELWHASVESFIRPEKALEAFTAQPQAYDMIITDVRMPVMSGIELASKIHDIRPNELVLYATAFDALEGTVGPLSLDSPVDDVIVKPIEVQTLCTKVKGRLVN